MHTLTDLLNKLFGPAGWNWWSIFGFAGEAVFFGRFFVQWLASERAGRSHFPTIFWYLSILGTTMLTVYAVQRHDPVFILGSSLPIVFYVRNLVLIHRERAATRAAGPASP